MKTAVHVLVCLCCLCVIALPAAGATSANQEVAPAGLPSAPLLSFLIEPVPQTCSVVVECDDGSTVMCNGASSCSTNNGGRCVICDGVQGGCCAKTCCEVCEDSYFNCSINCDPSVPVTCNICERVYNRCVNNCTGGCF